jgi:hypothetical protein
MTKNKGFKKYLPQIFPHFQITPFSHFKSSHENATLATIYFFFQKILNLILR